VVFNIADGEGTEDINGSRAAFLSAQLVVASGGGGSSDTAAAAAGLPPAQISTGPMLLLLVVLQLPVTFETAGDPAPEPKPGAEPSSSVPGCWDTGTDSASNVSTNPGSGYVVGAASAEDTLAAAAAGGAWNTGPPAPPRSAGCRRSSKIPLAHDSPEAEADDHIPVSLPMLMFAPTSSSALLGVSGTASSSEEHNPGGSPVRTGAFTMKLYTDLPRTAGMGCRVTKNEKIRWSRQTHRYTVLPSPNMERPKSMDAENHELDATDTATRRRL